MIRVEVEDYCQSCLDFAADVTTGQKSYSEDLTCLITDTVIHCKYRRRCAAIRRFLEAQLKGEEK